MKTHRILRLFLLLPGLLAVGCAGKVSGRFDMNQRFATGVVIKDLKSQDRTP
jgi:hypothetical protein